LKDIITHDLIIVIAHNRLAAGKNEGLSESKGD
jgi:hypothetical protein